MRKWNVVVEDVKEDVDEHASKALLILTFCGMATCERDQYVNSKYN